MTRNTDSALPSGTIVQYRKVGTFRIVSSIDGTAHGWYFVDPVKVPKRYREKGRITMCVGPHNVVS